MTVDIVLATYNGDSYLAAQIDSILAQDYPDWQLIIRDDNSTDATCDVIDRYRLRHPGRIHVMADELRGEKKRLGIVGNFSMLLAATRAPYIMCADQDDVWLPNKISLTLTGMHELEKQAGSDVPLLVHTDSAITDAALAPVAKSFGKYHKLTPEESPFARLLVQNTVQGCTIMVNRALLALALPLPPVVRMHDMWLALVAAGFGQIGYIEQATVQYRQHARNAVGARRKTLRERAGHIQTMMEANVTQAVLFLDRFKDRLPEETRRLASALSQMPDHGFFKRRLVLIRNDLLRRPGWQNVPMLIFV